MSEVDDYVEARKEADRIVAKVGSMRGIIQNFATALSNTPHQAAQQIPRDWPTRDELVRLLDDAAKAFDKMHNAWRRVPDDQKAYLTKPRKDLQSS